MKGVDSANRSSGSGFRETRWSLVAAARGGENARDAIALLCRDYWYPAYAYVRRSGHTPEGAYDVCQAFFSQLLATLRRVDPRVHGRFREFLLGELTRFLATDWRHADSEPEAMALSASSLEELEARHLREIERGGSPEDGFERGFALELLARGVRRLRSEAAQSGRLALFEQLEPYLTREPAAGEYEQIERGTALRPLVAVVAIRRLRQRFRELVEAELAQTVASGADLDAERETLLAILGAVR